MRKAKKARRNIIRDKEKGVASFKQNVNRWAEKIGVCPKRIQIQPMTTKWASCSTAGRVTFSADLPYENSRFVEYVIVHELLHLQIPNHGKLFKSLLIAYVPDWKTGLKGKAVCHITPHDTGL